MRAAHLTELRRPTPRFNDVARQHQSKPGDRTSITEDAILKQLRALVGNGNSTAEVQAKKIMSAALDLQQLQNDADYEWLQEQDIASDVLEEIFIRSVQRGGAWLDFLKAMVGLEGRSFKELETSA